jgi:hypothetical protein
MAADLKRVSNVAGKGLAGIPQGLKPLVFPAFIDTSKLVPCYKAGL